MSMEIRITGFRPKSDCQFTGRSQCDCFVVTLPGVQGAALVSPGALATWVKNRVAATEKLQTQPAATSAAKSQGKSEA